MYDPFGSPSFYDGSYSSISNSAYGWNYLHQGLRWDGVIGKMWNRFRDYDPEQGRFIENDPIGFDGGDIDFYRYVGNSPLNRSDPSGLGPYGGAPDPKKVIEARQRKRQAAEQAIDASLKAKINSMKWLLCQEAKDRVYAALMELVKIARELWYGVAGETPFGGSALGGGTGFFGDCEKWQAVYMAKMHETIVRLRKEGIVGCVFEVDEVSWGNYLTGGIAGHNAIRIQFKDGTNIYLDDGNIGKLDHVFEDADLSWSPYTPHHPAKAIFTPDSAIKAKCKISGATCVEHLCGIQDSPSERARDRRLAR